MKNILNKLGIGSYLILATFLLTIVSWIIYGAGVLAEGYFHYVSVPFVILFNIFTLLCLALAFALTFFPKQNNILDKILPIVQSALLIGAVVFLMANAINIIGARAEGLAYVFFSNDDVSAEVQTAANLSSAKLSITGFVFYLVTWLVAVITPFFALGKKEVQTVAE